MACVTPVCKEMYSVKEIFYTLQGEGGNAGRAAVFCRFSGCNLWTGLEKHRQSAICQFCDTDFVGTDGLNGGKFKGATSLAEKISSIWEGRENRLVVFTGGEPALQLDDELISAVHDEGFEIAVETNGTLALPENIDWVCVSPKANTNLKVTRGNELKLVFPQANVDPNSFINLSFDHFFIQPLDNGFGKTDEAIKFVRNNSLWRLSLQSHKYIGIP